MLITQQKKERTFTIKGDIKVINESNEDAKGGAG